MDPNQPKNDFEESASDTASLFGGDGDNEDELARQYELAVAGNDNDVAEQQEEQQAPARPFQPLFLNMDHASLAYTNWVSSKNEAVAPGTNDRVKDTRNGDDNALVELVFSAYWNMANTLEANMTPIDIKDMDLQLIGWRLVGFVYKAQAGETSLRPTYSGSRVKHQKFDTFMERFGAVIECLMKSKQICKNILDSDEYMARLAWNPHLEYRRKVNNAAGNRRRNFQNQATVVAQKAGILEVSKDGKVYANVDNGNKLDLGQMALPRQSKLMQEELEDIPTRDGKGNTSKCHEELGVKRKRKPRSDSGKQRKRPSKRDRNAGDAAAVLQLEGAQAAAPAQQMPAIAGAAPEPIFPPIVQQEPAFPGPAQQAPGIPDHASPEPAFPFPARQEPAFPNPAQNEPGIPGAEVQAPVANSPAADEPFDIMNYLQLEGFDLNNYNPNDIFWGNNETQNDDMPAPQRTPVPTEPPLNWPYQNGMQNAAMPTPQATDNAPAPAVAQAPGQGQHGQHAQPQHSPIRGRVVELRRGPPVPNRAVPEPNYAQNMPGYPQAQAQNYGNNAHPDWMQTHGNNAFTHPQQYHQSPPGGYQPRPVVQAGAQGSSTAYPAQGLQDLMAALLQEQASGSNKNMRRRPQQ